MRRVIVKGISFCVVCSCLLAGCSKNNNVDIVKNTVFEEYSNAISVGQALDNFAGCQPKTQKWAASETSNGAQIVEFTCTAQDMQELVSSIKEYAEEHMAKKASGDPAVVAAFSGIRNALDMSRAQYRIQFTLAKDKQSSQISFAGFDYMWRDGKTEEPIGNVLTRIYSNQTVKDELKVSSYKNLPDSMKDAFGKTFMRVYGKALKANLNK